MEQIDVQAHAFAGTAPAHDWGRAQPRVVRLDATTYGVKDPDDNRWHWVHWAPAQQRWTCGCAQGRLCRHIEDVIEKVRYRELWRAV